MTMHWGRDYQYPNFRNAGTGIEKLNCLSSVTLRVNGIAGITLGTRCQNLASHHTFTVCTPKGKMAYGKKKTTKRPPELLGEFGLWVPKTLGKGMMERRKRGSGAGSGPCLCTFWSGGNREVGSRETLGSFIHWWRTSMTDMSLKSDPDSGRQRKSSEP